ncbi:MAG: glycosyltransferase, partial [Burkholderiales bacterium]|nr:glycosyltransferase [Burkholderiales bacterium]
MKLSVIVPVLNEERVLPRLLRGLEVLRRSGVEVIVVDGGSADGSQALVVSAGIALVCAMRGRAQQMNAGAATAFGDVLLFLHADTRLPDGGKGLIDAALTGNRHVW